MSGLIIRRRILSRLRSSGGELASSLSLWACSCCCSEASKRGEVLTMLRCLDVSLTQAQVGGCCCKEDLLCRAVDDRGGGADWNADSLPAQERSRNSGMDEVIIIDELRLYDRSN